MWDKVTELFKKNPTILWIEVWSSKWVQKVLNAIAQNNWKSFEEIIASLKKLLTYPWIWDEGNISRFIDVFYQIVKKYSWDRDNRITLQQVWWTFEWLRKEQLMEKVTLSVESDVNNLLSSRGWYASASDRVEWTPVGAFK